MFFRGLTRYQFQVQGLVRILAGLLFMEHGLQKIFGMLKGSGLAATGQSVPLGSMMGAAGLIELVGGALLVLGLLTIPVSLIMAVEMAVAYFMAHAPKAAFPIENQGELALVYCLLFLIFGFSGPGAFALDNRIGAADAIVEDRSIPRPAQPTVAAPTARTEVRR